MSEAAAIRGPVRSPLREAIRSTFAAINTAASGNSATRWLFAQNGMEGTPWADLSRTGFGTRVGATGLVEYGPHNLLLQRNNFASASWNKSGGTVVEVAGAGRNGESAWRVSGLSASDNDLGLKQPIVASGQTIHGAFWIKGEGANVGRMVRLQVRNVDGVYAGVETVFTLTAEWQLADASFAQISNNTGAASVLTFVAAGGGTSATAVLVCDAQVNLGAALFDVPTTTTARYLPIIDYDPVTLARLGLRVQGQAANEIGSHSLASPQMVTQTVTVTAAQRTLSFYGTGTVTLSGAHTATVVGTGAYPSRRTLTFTPSAGSLTLTVSGTVQYPQLEAGAVASSYIPNPGTGSAVRAADDWFLSGAAFAAAVTPSVGTLIVQFWWDGAPSIGGVASINGGSSANQIAYRAGSQQLTVTVGGASIATLSTAAPVIGLNKVAFSWSSAGAQVSLNGAAPETTTSNCAVPLADRLHLGMLEGAAAHVNNVIAFAESRPGQYITGSALQALSA